jgi:hypothetical protein
VIATYGSSAAAASTANTIRSGRLTAYAPTGHYDAKARTVGKEYRVYAVYLGESGTRQ